MLSTSGYLHGHQVNEEEDSDSDVNECIRTKLILVGITISFSVFPFLRNIKKMYGGVTGRFRNDELALDLYWIEYLLFIFLSKSKLLLRFSLVVHRNIKNKGSLSN